ncbi:MAG: carbon starvation protein A [Desulfonatronovibrio sp.]
MLLLLSCIGLLVLSYFTYGKVVERIFVPDPIRATPCYTMTDGVDYASMPTWKVFFIQILNIAGIGPIFGPILGALYGPIALVWIIVGAVFAGAVHDYFSGMLSVRNKGASIPDVVGSFLGCYARYLMRFFSLLLLLLVGVVFILSPAQLLSSLTGLQVPVFIACIFGYYFLATILPINKIIGHIYPFFGALLMFMTLGIFLGMALSDVQVLPNLDISRSTHPEGLPVWPLLFITLSCGAISGFHSTQSPLMARCIRNESRGRLVFYGAMIAEGAIALVWAAAGMSLFHGPEALYQVIQTGTPSLVVDQVCRTLLGPVGGFLAILGVIILPITSGDTAFRSSRLILAETFNLSQSKSSKRLLLAVPLFITAAIVASQDFQVIWRYFGWSNQTLAMLVLWSAAVYLRKQGKCHWIATTPAMFMTAVCVSFILQASIGFSLSPEFSNPAGLVAAFLALVVLLRVTPG